MRIIGAVVAGYAVVLVLTVASAGILWLVIGPEAGFAEGTTVASTTWAVGELVLGFVSAIAAGYVAAAVGKHPTNLPVKILGGIIVVLGLLIAYLSMGAEPVPVPEGKTVGEMTFVEAGQVASDPLWTMFALPLVGFVGVMLGGSMRTPEIS